MDVNPPPETAEGHFVLHQCFSLDWERIQAAPDADRSTMTEEAVRFFADHVGSPAEGSTGIFSIVGGKGDLMVIHLRPTLDEVNAVELAQAQLALSHHMKLTSSYVSVVELSVHGGMRKRNEKMLKDRGLEPGTEPFEQAMAAFEAAEAQRREIRLKPGIPDKRYVCFYPMSKKRGEHKNWYTLPPSERGRIMRSHGMVGSKYTDRVTQVISGSIGFDDYEWGVDLYADEPVVFKKLIYEMRFDEASNHYALFGPFFIGIRLAPQDLSELVKGRLPESAGAEAGGN